MKYILCIAHYILLLVLTMFLKIAQFTEYVHNMINYFVSMTCFMTAFKKSTTKQLIWTLYFSIFIYYIYINILHCIYYTQDGSNMLSKTKTVGHDFYVNIIRIVSRIIKKNVVVISILFYLNCIVYAGTMTS